MGLFFLSQFKLHDMCLTATHRRVKIAKEDIVCYKTLRVGLISPWKESTYELNKLVKSSLDSPDKDMEIFEGLHAYTQKEQLNYNIGFLNYFFGVPHFRYKAIIPKGSRYYLGRDNEIVSNQMIIKKLIK